MVATATPPMPKSVAVIGGGLAGITATVKLFQQGYTVTLFEKEAVLGGNFSSNSRNEKFYKIPNANIIDNPDCFSDVYPHIFGDWYSEFWYLLENDLHICRDDIFVSREPIRLALMPKIDDPHVTDFSKVDFATIWTPTSFANLLDDLSSGVMSRRDMFLFGYTYLDLAAVPRSGDPSKVLDKLDVNGYLYSRPYMNNNIAEFHDDILKIIWSMPSDQTSAMAYRDLLRHTILFPNENPFGWFINGPIEEKLMEPVRALLSKAFAAPDEQSDLKLQCKITSMSTDTCGGSQVEITWIDNRDDCDSDPQSECFDYVVLATDPEQALTLAFSQPNDPGLLKQVPGLSLFREAEAGRIPVVYLQLNKAFVDQMGDSLFALPSELIGFKIKPHKKHREPGNGEPRPPVGTGSLADPDYDISILNLTELWSGQKSDKDGLKLVLAASAAVSIPECGPDEKMTDGIKQGFAIIKKLHDYLPFITVGNRWASDYTHIDWDNTHVITNEFHQLFLNDADSAGWRPFARVDKLKNVFFAGDYCRTDVDMATVEAAVQSGVLAAQALQVADQGSSPVVLQPHRIYATSPLLLVKLLASPLAFLIALSETFEEAGRDPVKAITYPASAMVLAANYAADWLQGAVNLYTSLIPGSETSPSGGAAVESVPDHDERIGLVKWAVNTGLSLATEAPRLAPLVREGLAEATYGAWYWTIGKRLFPDVPRTLQNPKKGSLLIRTGPNAHKLKDSSLASLAKSAFSITKVTPAALERVVFEKAATALALIKIVRPDPPSPPGQPRPEPKPRTWWDAVLKAAQKGADEAALMGQGNVSYSTKRPL